MRITLPTCGRSFKMGSMGWGAVFMLSLVSGSLYAQDNNNRQEFDIDSQPLSKALHQFSEQTKLIVLASGDVVRGRVSTNVEGEYLPLEALALMLADSGVDYEVKDAETLLIRARAESEESGGSNEKEKKADQKDKEVEEIIVTGTQIRGIQNSASPLMVFDREEIQKSGFSTTHQFIQSLPQNFGGGTSEITVGGVLGGEGSNLNFGNASGVNLRGLGNDATLTLLNGRRVAPVGVGDAVDLSMIPLAAIERIDVLTDGASAIYGSDAVGGVVNIVLRKGYDGAETHLRYGNVTHGGNDEYKLGQTFGTNWGSGEILFSYEYTDRKPLTNDERDYTSSFLFEGVALVPPNEQHNGLLTLSQQLAKGVEMYADVLYSTRDTEYNYTRTGFSIVTPTTVTQYSATAGSRIELNDSWQADVGFAYSNNHTEYDSLTNGISFGGIDMESDVFSFDAKTDGTAFMAPGGEAKLALAGHYRRETFNSIARTNTNGEDSRNVKAVSTELFMPLVGDGNRMAGVERLELTIAGRYEDYSDFGSTTNPKVGLLWSPVSGLNFRTTYGTSFRAPQLYELSEAAVPLRPLAYVMPDPLSTTGVTPTLVLQGNNDELNPEEATNWTFGLDIQPEALPGFELSITYFDIEFTDRIANPIPVAGGFFSALVNEANHPSVIDRNPDLNVVAAWLADPNFLNFTGGPITAGDIGVIVNNQLANVASVEETGLDFDVNYGFDTEVGRFSVRIGGTYLIDKKHKVTSASPATDELNLVRAPVDLKLRNSVGWSRDELSATIYINYVDSYKNVLPGGMVDDVDSWTTIDTAFRYEPEGAGQWLQDTTWSFNVLNILNEDPPYASNFGLNFDATNANPLGRYISIDLIKRW